MKKLKISHFHSNTCKSIFWVSLMLLSFNSVFAQLNPNTLPKFEEPKKETPPRTQKQPTKPTTNTVRETEAQAEDRAWQTAKSSNNKNSYERYLSDYPSGRYVTQAKQKISEIETAERNKKEQERQAEMAREAESRFTDPRDGKTYKTVRIGNQIWMAENLNYVTSSGSWCYDNKTSNCNTYGRLYDWQTARNACPPGWHLPSDAEWKQLTDYLGGTDVAGGKMKSTKSWREPNTGATNSSGFSGLPGGCRYYNGDFTYIGDYGYWWSSTEYTTGSAWYRSLHYNPSTVNRNYYVKPNGFSCRCIRD